MDDTIGENGQDEERPLAPARGDGRVAEPSRDGIDPEQEQAEVEEPPEASQVDRYLDQGYSVKQIIALGFARETVRDEAGRRREVRLQTRVFAASNTTKMPRELLSRFLVLYFKPYSREEFLEVTAHLLIRTEKVKPDIASYVAQKAWEVRGAPDPREAIRISRLAKSRAEVDRVCEVLLKYSAR